MDEQSQNNSTEKGSQPPVESKRKRFSVSRKFVIFLVSAIVLVGAAAFSYIYIRDNSDESDAASCVTKTLSSSSSSSCVKYAQRLLNGASDYYYAIPKNNTTLTRTEINTKGKMDTETTDRIKVFQAYAGEQVSGTVDKNTWSSLCSYVYTAYKGFSTNLLTKALSTAKSAYSSAGCSKATREPVASQEETVSSTTSTTNDTDTPVTETPTGSTETVSPTEVDPNASQPVDDTAPTSLKTTLVTWNIAGGSAGFDGAARANGIKTLSTQADIIGLQESHVTSFRQTIKDELACDVCSDGNAAALQTVILQGIPVGTDIYTSSSSLPASTPILWNRARFTLEGYGAFTALANSYTDENGDRVSRKWITWVQLHDNTANKSLYVINLHTPAGVESAGTPISKMKKRNSTYKTQMQLLSTVIKDNFTAANVPIYVLGDFNVDYRTDKTVKYKYYPYVTFANLGFTSNWAFADANEPLPAGGTGSSTRLIDYIAIKESLGMSFDSTSINADMFGSDHHPVFATVSYPTSN